MMMRNSVSDCIDSLIKFTGEGTDGKGMDKGNPYSQNQVPSTFAVGRWWCPNLKTFTRRQILSCVWLSVEAEEAVKTGSWNDQDGGQNCWDYKENFTRRCREVLLLLRWKREEKGREILQVDGSFRCFLSI